MDLHRHRTGLRRFAAAVFIDTSAAAAAGAVAAVAAAFGASAAGFGTGAAAWLPLAAATDNFNFSAALAIAPTAVASRLKAAFFASWSQISSNLLRQVSVWCTPVSKHFGQPAVLPCLVTKAFVI